MIKPERAEQN